MTNKNIFIFLILTIVGVCNMHLFSTAEMGLNTTGAPQENNCSTCHIGTANPDNLGSTEIFVNGSSRAFFWEKDTDYEIEVKSVHANIEKFGFALSTRYSNVIIENVGSYSAISPGLNISNYVTHSLSSNTGNGSKSWKFNWKSPKGSVSNDTVIFYLAAVMANNNGDTRGDKVYLDTLYGFLKNNVNSIQEFSGLKESIQWFQAGNQVKCFTKQAMPQSINLIDINGTVTKLDINQENNEEYLINLPKLANGIYYLNLDLNGKSTLRKVILVD